MSKPKDAAEFMQTIRDNVLYDSAVELAKLHTCTIEHAKELLWMGLSYETADKLLGNVVRLCGYNIGVMPNNLNDAFNELIKILYTGMTNETQKRMNELKS